MSKSSEDDSEAIAADLVALRKDIARLAESVGALAHHRTQVAEIHVPEVRTVASDHVPRTGADGQKLMRWVARGEVEASIERGALTALAVAFSLGLAVGVLVRSRR